MIKKTFLLIFLLLDSFLINALPCFGEVSYKINNVTYEISGITRESVLSQKLNIDTNIIFSSEEDLKKYIGKIKQNIENFRVIETSEIVESYSSQDETGLIKVDLLIKTNDSINFVVVPYPTYDINTGFKLKLKIKDYNFLGSMDELNSSLIYFLRIDEDSGSTSNYFDFSFGFDVPFMLGPLSCKWNNDFSLNYVVGNSNIGFDIKEGIDFSLPILNITSLDLSLSQSFIQNPSLTNDLFYFNTSAAISIPLNIAEIPDVGYLTWAPGLSFNFNWDKDLFSVQKDFGISTEELLGPNLSITQKLFVGKVNWLSNFKDGFSAQVNVSYSYNFTTYSFDPFIDIQLERYHAFTNNAISTRLYYFVNTNGQTSIIGDRVRGVRDNDIKSNSALCANLDFPIKLFQTDWVDWLKNTTGKELNWLSYVDFEAQISPFLDFVLGHNNKTGTFYNIRDSYISTGIEILGFPNKFRSIQGRLSFGVDLIHLFMLIGENSSFVNKAVSRVFDTTWRNDPFWEIFFGIGMFY